MDCGVFVHVFCPCCTMVFYCTKLVDIQTFLSVLHARQWCFIVLSLLTFKLGRDDNIGVFS